MATGQDIIAGALRHAEILEQGEDPSPEELQDGLEDLNDWASLYEHSSLALGFVRLDAVTDTINIPNEAEGFYKLALAEYIAPQYGVSLNLAKVELRRTQEEALLRLFSPVIDVQFPDSLPIGTGNQTSDYDRFFPKNKERNF